PERRSSRFSPLRDCEPAQHKRASVRHSRPSEPDTSVTINCLKQLDAWKKGATALSSHLLQNRAERLIPSFVLDRFAQKVLMTGAANTVHSCRVALITRSVLINAVALVR